MFCVFVNQTFDCIFLTRVHTGGTPVSQMMFWLVRVALIGAMLALNSVMLGFLVRAMHALGTAPATTIINAFSFGLSGLVGLVVFGETLALRWWVGLGFILSGVACIAIGSGQDDAEVAHATAAVTPASSSTPKSAKSTVNFVDKAKKKMH
jgi:multidrug transporter EmrE-like cation transporter